MSSPESGMAGRVITGTDGPFRYLAESSRVFDPPEAVADHFSARSPTRPFPANSPDWHQGPQGAAVAFSRPS
jgi:hypothetical protein